MEQASAFKSRVEFLPPPSENWNMAQEMLAAFQRHSNRTLLVDAARRRHWTGAQLLRGAGSIATGLIRQVGLKPGQVVFMVSDHSDDEILMVLGIILAGGAFYGTTPDDGLAEIKTLCELELPHVLVTNSRLHHMTLELRKSVQGLEEAPIIWLDDPCKIGGAINGNGYQGDIDGSPDANNNNLSPEAYWLDLIDQSRVILANDLINGHHDEQLIERIASASIKSQEQILTLMLTSGSTGRPKVVANTHEELIYGLYSMISATKRSTGSGSGGDDGGTILPLDEKSILAGDLPLDHGAGLNTMLLSFSIGSNFIVMPSYEEDTFWEAVHNYRITSSIASTTFAFRLLTRLQALINLGRHKQFDLSCFTYLTCVGSKMAFGDLIGEINKTYKQIHVSQGYGATEIGFITMLSAQDCRSHLNSVGHLFPGLLAKVVDFSDTGTMDRESGGGKVLGPNKRGELCLWARSKFKQYKCQRGDDPGELLEACHDQQGFYRTGDQVHYDEDGRLYVHGRFRDTLFLAQDWKILPSELEDLVDKHPLVEQSAVLGIPDPDLPGCHAPRAFVKLISIDGKGDSHQLNGGPFEAEGNHHQLDHQLRHKLQVGDRKFIIDHIEKFVADQCAPAKHLRGGIIILDEFPKVGLLNKIDRKALKSIVV